MAHNPGYYTYMKSAAWHRRRNRAIKRAGTRCEYVNSQKQRCWKQSHLHVHHKTYERFGREKARDLQVLCEDHHAVAELLKCVCYQCGKPFFADAAAALAFWKLYKRKYPKDWAAALDAAKAAAVKCGACNDKGRSADGARAGPL
jgi:hypothetical protein